MYTDSKCIENILYLLSYYYSATQTNVLYMEWGMGMLMINSVDVHFA